MENIKRILTTNEAVPNINFDSEIRKIMDWMPGGFFIYKAHDNEELIYANQAVVKMFLCDSLEDFRKHTNNSFKGIVYEKDLAEVENRIWDQINNNVASIDHVEYRFKRKDGSIRWASDYGHLIRSGNEEYFCVFIGDNTENKLERLKKENDLKTSLAMYAKKFEGLNNDYLQKLEVIECLSYEYDSVFYVDLNESTVKAYQTSDRIENLESKLYDYNYFMNNYVNRYVYKEDKELLIDQLMVDNIINSLTNRKSKDILYRIFIDNKEEYYQLHIVNVGEVDDVSQVVMGTRNVDEIIRRNEQQTKILEKALEDADESIKVKNAFLANMSHDLRTPLNAILGYIPLINDNLDDKELVNNYLENIEKAGRKLLGLVDRVLDMTSSAETQIGIEVLGKVDDLLKEIINDSRYYAEDKNIKVIYENEFDHNELVYLNKRKIAKAFEVIYDNALKYTSNNGKVIVKLEENNKNNIEFISYKISVIDNGIGIKEEFLDHLFKPFERQENYTISKVYGSGVGLYLAKNYIDSLGGDIKVKSKYEEGSTFEIYLSLKKKEKSLAKDYKKYNGQKILIVEDNELNSEIEKALLESEGFDVDLASDGKIGYEKIKNAKEGEYALVFMDLSMPIMDGYEASEAIRNLENEKLRNIPIVAVSANSYDEDRLKAAYAGMNDHIPKPVDISDLITAISRFTTLLD